MQFPTQMGSDKDVEMVWATAQFREKGMSLQDMKYHSRKILSAAPVQNFLRVCTARGNLNKD